MSGMWDSVPRVNIVPIMVGYRLTYEIRTSSGSLMLRPNSEKDAITWCRENAYDYTVQRKQTT